MLNGTDTNNPSNIWLQPNQNLELMVDYLAGENLDACELLLDQEQEGPFVMKSTAGW